MPKESTPRNISDEADVQHERRVKGIPEVGDRVAFTLTTFMTETAKAPIRIGHILEIKYEDSVDHFTEYRIKDENSGAVYTVTAEHDRVVVLPDSADVKVRLTERDGQLMPTIAVALNGMAV